VDEVEGLPFSPSQGNNSAGTYAPGSACFASPQPSSIFLDWLRNQRGSTAVLPYSARAREGAPVAAPIAWDELGDYEGGNAFTIRELDLLIERSSKKLLLGWGEAKQALPGA
jgi:DNA primase